MIVLVVVVGLSKEVELPVELALLDSISFLPYPLIKLVTMLA